MPVVTNLLTQNTQPDGRVSVTLRLYDQDGTEVLSTAQLLPAGIDVNAWMSNRIFETDTQLAENEFAALIGL